MDWQVGDKAVCVDAKPRRHEQTGSLSPDVHRLIEGRVYTVAGVVGDASLALAEVPVPETDEWYGGFSSYRFRKIRPDEHEACEPEFVTLLKKSKKPAKVGGQL